MNDGRVGRKTHVVECRASSGTAIGGSLAFPGTMSEAQYPDVIVVAMSPGSRHITKPVCQITYALREAGLNVSVLVLASGTGVSSEEAPSNTLGSSIMSISDQEVVQVSKHAVAIIHVGNVPSHFIPKIKEILSRARVHALIVSQAPIDFDDLARAGIETKWSDGTLETGGRVIDLVNGVVRGQRCSQIKINEIVAKTKHALTVVKCQ
jgi:methyl-coenzyme M reductase subunit C